MAMIRKRIDNLGRIVIPKEIRSQLRIREGEKLEVTTSGEDIILKKQASQNDLSKISQQVIQFLHLFIDQKIIVTNRDYVIACSTILKPQYFNRVISEDLSKKIEDRNFKNGEEKLCILKDNYDKENVLIEPIIQNGDIEGIFIVIGGDHSISKIMRSITQFIVDIM